MNLQTEPIDDFIPEPPGVETLPPEIPEDTRDAYQKLRDRVREWEQKDGRTNRQWLEYAIITPDLFHLLLKLSRDKDVPVMSKAIIGAGIAYFVMPMDIIPDILPGGWIDDMAVAIIVLSYLIKDVDHAIIRRNWAGQGDIIEIHARYSDRLSGIIGPRVYRRVVSWVTKQSRRAMKSFKSKPAKVQLLKSNIKQ